MKQFYVKEYLKNPERRVVTRDGSPVRIICIDRAGMNTKPVVALLLLPNGDEVIESFWENGIETAGSDGKDDLFFLPNKKEGWVNLYTGYLSNVYVVSKIFSTEEDAKKEKPVNYITTIKVEWEE